MKAWPLLALLLAGCGQNASPLADYPARLRYLLAMPEQNLETPLLQKGGGRAWAQAVPTTTISLRQTFALRHCGLLGLIGERNGPLGKTAPPSQRFLYDLKLLDGLARCQPADPELKALVAQLLEEKRQALPAVAWQLVSDDEAFRANWRFDRAPMGDFAGLGEATALLHDLRELLKTPDPKRMARLEEELGHFGEGRLLGRLNQALSDARLELDAVTEALEQGGPAVVCLNGHPGRQAKEVRDFFFSYYGKQVQPYLGDLVQTDRGLKGELWPLIQALPHPDNPQIRFLAGTGEGTLSGDFLAALGRHTKAWQAFLGRCGLRPGQ
ncbi:DUF3080 family protein [Gallaecimonas kandeliae]|uniref:DUF3080 family protein n=1 Tax=Gallaecimonas kandeliae TaxID=3029055 RepID=UPI0026497B21|nr:DUF3080 family protein [Gallaecimonas kandeliae]WKE64063.1 DUF3080 family protein [Gallaecimonas kandeliae]